MGSADTKDIEAFLTAVYRAVASAGAAAGPPGSRARPTLLHAAAPFFHLPSLRQRTH